MQRAVFPREIWRIYMQGETRREAVREKAKAKRSNMMNNFNWDEYEKMGADGLGGGEDGEGGEGKLGGDEDDLDAEGPLDDYEEQEDDDYAQNYFDNGEEDGGDDDGGGGEQYE